MGWHGGSWSTDSLSEHYQNECGGRTDLSFGKVWIDGDSQGLESKCGSRRYDRLTEEKFLVASLEYDKN